MRFRNSDNKINKLEALHGVAMTVPGTRSPGMYELIDIRGRTHEANVEWIANRVLNTVGASPYDDDIVKAIHYPVDTLDNMNLIRSIINCCFPSPSLNRMKDPWEIEDVVIEALVREHLSSQQVDGCSMTKH
jgi:hypothetical protein